MSGRALRPRKLPAPKWRWDAQPPPWWEAQNAWHAWTRGERTQPPPARLLRIALRVNLARVGLSRTEIVIIIRDAGDARAWAALHRMYRLGRRGIKPSIDLYLRILMHARTARLAASARYDPVRAPVPEHPVDAEMWRMDELLAFWDSAGRPKGREKRLPPSGRVRGLDELVREWRARVKRAAAEAEAEAELAWSEDA